MPTDPHVVDALRAMFNDGATPSQLIRFIISRHQNDSDWHHLIQRYFRLAFLVPVVRIMNDPDRWEQADLSHWDLNIHLLHRMVENRPIWNQHAANTEANQQSWLDSLVATDEAELIRQAQPPAELAGSWPELAPAVKEYVGRITGNVHALYERVLILARLAERLQQQVAEAQSQRVLEESSAGIEPTTPKS
jgi:hypothetical protein